ncbi:hypothetical protein MIS45_09970 [Wielerella bovis]|uniref:hypothetical protein n=1 Tax=Wielerella bovis TaxID=2917790 RepID=UPI0020199903|nr:hypothetical protein [Wielerella bovis]ULJ69067.1 hypothetical protein MIS45_09970 [Wielerella bovis]
MMINLRLGSLKSVHYHIKSFFRLPYGTRHKSFRRLYNTRQKIISVGRAFMPDIDEAWCIASSMNARPIVVEVKM